MAARRKPGRKSTPPESRATRRPRTRPRLCKRCAASARRRIHAGCRSERSLQLVVGQAHLCARMHPSAGRREDSVAVYPGANRADPRRVVGVRAPTIRTRDPCHSDTRKPRRSDTRRFRWLLRSAPQAPHRIRELAFAPSARSSR